MSTEKWNAARAADTTTPPMMQKLDAVKWDMLHEWAQPKHAAWMHDDSMATSAQWTHAKVE